MENTTQDLQIHFRDLSGTKSVTIKCLLVMEKIFCFLAAFVCPSLFPFLIDQFINVSSPPCLICFFSVCVCVDGIGNQICLQKSTEAREPIEERILILHAAFMESRSI